MTDVFILYINMMYDHGIHDMKISRHILLQKIEQNISNFTITEARGTKPATIHSKVSGRSAIDQAMWKRDLKGDMTSLYRCLQLIRQVIIQT